MISQQTLINPSYTNTIPNYTKNPMTESKKFCMKGLTILKNKLRKMYRKEKNPQDGLSKHDLKILDRYYTPKKSEVMHTDITTKSKYGFSPSLVCCKFLIIKSIFSSFIFIHNKNLKK